MCIGVKCYTYFTMPHYQLQRLWVHTRPCHLRSKRVATYVGSYTRHVINSHFSNMLINILKQLCSIQVHVHLWCNKFRNITP